MHRRDGRQRVHRRRARRRPSNVTPNARLLRTGANLGYGSAVNRAVAEYLADPATSGDSEFFVVANPDVVWGPGSIDAMLEAAGGGRAPGRSVR